jgi:hypothetical protein
MVMSRELVVQLIKKKKALYQEQHAFALEELAAEEVLAYCALESEAELEVKLREVNAKKLAVESKIKRSHLFGQRYSHSFIPSLCIVCFVDHNVDSLMVEVESDRGNGIRQFECPTCKHVLRVNPL